MIMIISYYYINLSIVNYSIVVTPTEGNTIKDMPTHEIVRIILMLKRRALPFSWRTQKFSVFKLTVCDELLSYTNRQYLKGNRPAYQLT